MKANPSKVFNCIAFKREAALRLHEKLRDMAPEQEQRFWQRRNRAFAARWAESRRGTP